MKHSNISFFKKLNGLFSLLLLAFFSSIIISSCSKGPAGPAGPIGSTGPQGTTGTANVIYSAWFTPSTYTKDTVFGTYGFYFNQAAPEITQQILDSSVVITYGKLDGYTTVIWPTNQVAPLPIVITYMNGANANIDTWSALLTPGNVEIQLQSSTNAYGGISNAHKFRYVIIPAGVAAARPALGATSIPDYANMSYQQLCSTFNIPE
jgi:hypothetical protein